MNPFLRVRSRKHILKNNYPDQKNKKVHIPGYGNPLHNRVLLLQKTKGNQAVQRLFRSGIIQAKLRIGKPGDKHEKEADRVAETVMNTSPGGPDIQQKCPECEDEMHRQPEEEEEVQKQEEEEEEVQRQEEEEEEVQPKGSHVNEITPDLESSILSLKGGGHALPGNLRAFFEPRFNMDLGHVRIHTDQKAADSAHAIKAHAFTIGRNVVFGAGQYEPGTGKGKKLIAHELVHVVQQTGHKRGNNITQTGNSVQRACSRGRWTYECDGCSLPGWVTGLLGIRNKDNPAGGRDTWFGTNRRGAPCRRGDRRACDNHDRCYQTCGSSRAACDLNMYRDMMATCRRSSASSSIKRDCRKWARIYYAGLVGFGGLAHAQRQAQVCFCGLRGLFP